MKRNMITMLALLVFSGIACIRVEAAAKKLYDDVSGFDENVREALKQGPFDDSYAEFVTQQIADYRTDADNLNPATKSDNARRDLILLTLEELDTLLPKPQSTSMPFAASGAGKDTFDYSKERAHTKSSAAGTEAASGAGTWATEEAPTSHAYAMAQMGTGFEARALADSTAPMNPLLREYLEQCIQARLEKPVNQSIEDLILEFISTKNNDLCTLLGAPRIQTFFTCSQAATLSSRLQLFINHIFHTFLLTNNVNATNKDACFVYIASLINNITENKNSIITDSPYSILSQENIDEIIIYASELAEQLEFLANC